MVYFPSSRAAKCAENKAYFAHTGAKGGVTNRMMSNKSKMGRRHAFAAVVMVGSLLLPTAAAVAQSASTWEKRGQEAETREDYDAAFEAYRQARLLKPKDLRYKTHFERVRFMAAAAHVDRGRVLRQNGDFNGALLEFQRAVAIDGGNQAALQEIELTQRQMAEAAAAQQAAQPPDPEVTTTLAGPIQLQPVANDPITLHMVEDVKVIYQAIGKAAGLNVIFDPDYTSRRIQVDLNGVSLPDALRIVGTISGTFWKPITTNTIFVAQNTQAKRTDLENKAVQTFYLNNVAAANDANELLTALRNIFPPDVKIFLVPSQNAIVMRASPDQLELAKQLLANLDRAKPEVVVDVAVLSVSKDKARNLGITLPQSVSVTPQVANSTTSSSSSSSSSTTTSSSLSLRDLAHLTGDNFAVSVSGATVNALLSDTDTRILQNPKVRATDGQRAQLKIGQRIPIATGSYNAGVSTGLASIGVQTQFTYLDVGVNIDMTPTVHQDRDVTLKMKIEVSSQVNSVVISGVEEPIIGQNVIDQVIQLREGEPSILAGILTKQESKILSGTPGLSEIPLLKYLFSANKTDQSQSEVIFLLIPHIVREPILTRMNTRQIDTGTGQSIELRHEVVTEPVVPAVSAQHPVPMTAAAAARSALDRKGSSAVDAVDAAQRASAGGPMAQQAAAQAALNAANAAVAPVAAPVSFTIAPPDGNQTSGSTFQMAVIASNAKDLYSVPLQLQFDPKVLQLVNVDSGELLGRDGQAVAVVHRDEGNGSVTVSASRPPGVQGISGQGSVAVFTFKAIGAGDSRVSLIKVGAKNSTQANLPAVGSQAVVHVK